jgi:hypothetical protein
LQFRPTFSRRHFLKLSGAVRLGLVLPNFLLFAPPVAADEVHYLAVRDKVPDPKDIFFSVQYPGKVPIRLAGHFWYNEETVSAVQEMPGDRRVPALSAARRHHDLRQQDVSVVRL